MQTQMDKPKFRCSSLGHLMTNPVAKADKEAGNLSEGAKTHIVDVFTSWRYKRNEDVYSKYIEKGNELEKDAVTLVSVQTGIFFPDEPQVSFENEWICGTPDLILKDKQGNPEFIEDTKCSWDIFTFNRTKYKKLNDLYYWQMQGYMMLTGAKEARLRYCLLNATDDLIRDELRKLGYAMRLVDFEETKEFIDRAAKVERNMIYDLAAFRKRYPNFDLHLNVAEWKYDIAPEQRLFTIVIPRNESDIELIKNKVQKAWQYIDEILTG
jgi:hypothetical protein